MSKGNIIFAGDWVKVNGKWAQVQRTDGDYIRIFSDSDFDPGYTIVEADSVRMLRSDGEMQKILKQVGL